MHESDQSFFLELCDKNHRKIFLIFFNLIYSWSSCLFLQVRPFGDSSIHNGICVAKVDVNHRLTWSRKSYYSILI